MFNEEAYLTFKTGSLPKGTWLVLAPHADDETFGMGGAISKVVQEGGQVDILVMTDGIYGGSELNIREIREDEARNAIRILGCRNVTFLRQTDRGIKVNRKLIDFVRDLISQNSYSAVFFPSPVEPHPDHRITAQIGWEALRKLNFPCEPISYEISTQGPCNILVDISTVVDIKRLAMQAYASQITHTAYIERILGLNKSRTWSLPNEVAYAEAFHHWDKLDVPLSAQLNRIHRAQQSLDAIPETEDLISIIIRTANRPQMLREAIRSVASQIHSTIELIVVNDGELELDDLVAEEALGSIVSHVVLHRVPPHGRSRAANDGLMACTGAFIGFLDDDDWLLPHHVSTLLEPLRSSAALAAYGIVDSVRIVDSAEEIVYRFDASFDRLRLGYTNFMPIHGVLFRRSVVDKGCRFDCALELFEDWNFWLQVAQYGDFIFVPELVAKYRIGETSGIGLPSANRDTAARFRTFIEGTRHVWGVDQIEHICRSALAAETLRAQLTDAQREHALAIASSKVEYETTVIALEDLRTVHAQVLQQHQCAMEDWDAQVRALLSSRSWKLARLIQLPHRALRATVRLMGLIRTHGRNRG